MNTEIEGNKIKLIAINETFKPVIIDGKRYEGYWASNYKRLYSANRNIIMALRNKQGQSFYRLSSNGKTKQISPDQLYKHVFECDNNPMEPIADDEIFKTVILDSLPCEYKVSNYGRVFSVKNNSIMKQQIDKNGFMSCSLFINGKLKHLFVHYLVANAFLPNPDADNLTGVRHINGHKDDNYVNNLIWDRKHSKSAIENPKFDISKIELIAEDEIFKPVRIGKRVYNDYYISNYGRCYGVRRSTMLSQRVNVSGFIIYYLSLDKKGVKSSCYAHILTAEAFVDNPNVKAFRKVRHLDRDKINNKSDNLKWCESNKIMSFDGSIDGSDLELIADDEEFKTARTDKAVYDGYLISNYGRLYSRHSKMFIKGVVNFDGYLQYNLCVNSLIISIAAHRLVGFAFVENPDPDNFNMINHRDECRTNNYFKNLEFCDNDYNLNYNGAKSRREPFVGKRVIQKDADGKVVEIHDSISQAAEKFNVCMNSMRGWCRNNRSYRGFYWDYADGEAQ